VGQHLGERAVSVAQSANQAHNAAVAIAESARQAAVAAAGNNQAAVTAAEIAFYRACLASAKANGCGTEVFVTGLRSLGVNS